MSQIEKALIKCDDVICSLVAWWETPQHGRSTELDYLVEPQADQTEIAQTGPLELTAPMYIAPMYGAERSAPLQEIAEAVSRALACLTDRLIWPYCLPLMASMCLELSEEIVGAHEAYIRCAKRNGANLILSRLYDRLARLLGHSLLDERDPTRAAQQLSDMQLFVTADKADSTLVGGKHHPNSASQPRTNGGETKSDKPAKQRDEPADRWAVPSPTTRHEPDRRIEPDASAHDKYTSITTRHLTAIFVLDCLHMRCSSGQTATGLTASSATTAPTVLNADLNFISTVTSTMVIRPADMRPTTVSQRATINRLTKSHPTKVILLATTATDLSLRFSLVQLVFASPQLDRGGA